jgi:hypothetical protein
MLTTDYIFDWLRFDKSAYSCKPAVPHAEVVVACSAAVEQQISSRMANSGSIASIFKRGGQKPEFSNAADDPDAADASKQLDQHLQQLSVAWAAPRQRCVLTAAAAADANELLTIAQNRCSLWRVQRILF